MTNISPAELEARVRLHCLPELGNKRLRTLIDAFGNASSALSAPAAAWRALKLPVACAEARRDDSIGQRVNATLAWLEQCNHHLLMWDSPDYPALLAELPDAPPLLFVAGDPALLQQPQLAIVGSRRASKPGMDTAHAFARSLAAGGFVITSGMALGIDGAAHQGALAVGGKTVAVLGTGLEQIYPPRHRQLALEIAAQGALISELPLDSPPVAASFPLRNRIISGLSLGVLVVEASPSSGSLITARLALEQGREVYAIPGSIHHPGARGCHQLIRDGATLVECVEHIFEGLRGWQNVAPAPKRRAKAAPVKHPLLKLLFAAPHTGEALAVASGWSLPAVLAALSELEVEGRVANEGGVWVGR
ncbi:MAG: DNA-processing protein DprA [Pseudomonas sp.]